MMRGRLLFIDLPEDRRLVIDGLGPPAEETGRQATDFAVEGKLGAGRQTHRRAVVVSIGKAAGSGPEITRDKLIAHFRWRDRTFWRLKSHIGDPIYRPG